MDNKFSYRKQITRQLRTPELHAGPNFGTRPDPTRPGKSVTRPDPTRPANFAKFLDPTRPDPQAYP